MLKIVNVNCALCENILESHLLSSCTDICKAYRYVQQTKQSVQHIRDNVDDFHLQYFELACAKSEAVGGDIPAVPHCRGRQRG